jgi:ACS family tartrate transporter-like MFS transporter
VTASLISPLYRKITIKLVPFLMLLYMVAFLDRVNISFAALTMNRDLGISESLYGFAAGVFFLGYCLFELPANMLMARIGARCWMAALLVVWGATSVLTAFVQDRPQYVIARFLLGIAESGFFPGVVFYFTLWLPRAMRARILGLFLLAVPLCNSIGSPISAHILMMDQISGLRGWQWLFVLEGAPAVILGVLTWFVLVDGPAQAAWLSADEKATLARELQEDEDTSPSRSSSWLHLTRASVAYFLASVGLYGLTFWLPKLLVALGTSAIASGWWSVPPYAAGAVALVVMGRQRNQWWLPAMYLLSASGFLGLAVSQGLNISLICFAFASFGIFGALPLFWSAATAPMKGKAAGPGIAIVNSVGAIGAFTGPAIMGWLRDMTHSYSAGLWAIAVSMTLAALTVPRNAALDRVEAVPESA